MLVATRSRADPWLDDQGLYPNTMTNIQTDDTEGTGKDRGVLYVGIDLGTSRTSVTASNGVRETIESFVGYPKDPVAMKLLKKEVLFGAEAREKRLSLNLHRPLEHGVLKFNADGSENQDSRRAAMDLVKEIVRLSKPRKDELVYAVIGVPAQAQINNKDAILQAARESVDSVMLCSEPFSVAYGLDMLEDVLVIDIGAGTVDLCRMHGTMPEESDQITMNTAGDFVDEELGKEIRERVLADAQVLAEELELEQLDALWVLRERGRYAQASYGNGTWLLGEDRALAGIPASASAQAQTGGGEKDAERAALEQKIKRFLENQQRARRAQSSAEKADSIQAGWQALSVDARAQWLHAYYVEFGGDFELRERPYLRRCSGCGGRGVSETITVGGRTGQDGGTQLEPCAVCRGIGSVRRVYYR